MSAPFTSLELIQIRSGLRPLPLETTERIIDQLIELIDERVRLSECEEIWACQEKDLGEEIQSLQMQVGQLELERDAAVERLNQTLVLIEKARIALGGR